MQAKLTRSAGKGLVGLTLGAMLATASAGSAMAGDVSTLPQNGAVAEAPFTGKAAGDFMVRARLLGVVPNNGGSTSIGGHPDASNDIIPEVDFSYFVTDNIAVELIAGTSKHNVKAVGTAAGDIGLGSVKLLPPTLTAQYHFLPKERFSPYLGAGLNYTFFYDAKAPGGAITDIKYDNNLGYALQAGVDYAVTPNVYLNLDVKKIFLKTDVSVNGGAVTATADLDPWLIGVGVGYKF